LKYPPGIPISNFPLWKLQLGSGMALAILVFGAAWLTVRRKPWQPGLSSWIAIAISATTTGTLFGVAVHKMFYESYGVGGWLLWGSLLLAATVAPLVGANALMSAGALPTFLELLGPKVYRTRSALTIILGLALTVTVVIGAATALGFVFDQRYKDFPYASLTMATVPFVSLTLLNRPKKGMRPLAESVFAVLFAGAAVYTGINEGAQNWQSLWTCAAYVLLAITLWQARAAQNPE
jgi:glucan 1,3-beta-glucosidase